jgi:hypothetical protein
MATKAEVAAAKAKEAERKVQAAAAAAQAKTAKEKLSTFGSPADIDFTKQVAPKFSKMAEIAGRVAAKAPNRPEVLKSQGLTLEQLKEKTTAIQTGAAQYTTKAAGITQTEQDLATAEGLVTQYATPIYIPEEDKQPEDDKATRDAFALLKDTFALYNLSELSPVIEGFMKQGLTSNEAIIELRKNKVYQTRFAGNTTRTAAGLNALNEAEYLALEDSYSQTLRAYGQQTLLGTDMKTRQAKMATIIGADISPVEFKDRVSTVVTRVENADPLVKSTLRDFYKITDTDLVSYFLNPTENLPKLQEKVTAAEIGSAALAQGGLTTDMTSAESLAKFGVDLATARKGYSTISEVLPTATKLSQIYKEDKVNYNQQVAEEEVFKGLASAQRKRTQLAEKEIASFQGSAGLGAAGLSTQMLRKSSSAGQF